MMVKKTAQQTFLLLFFYTHTVDCEVSAEGLSSSPAQILPTFFWGVITGSGSQQPLLLLPTAASECPDSLPLSLTHAEINSLARVWQQAGL